MIHVEVKDLYEKSYVWLWSVLSFKAGMINAAGFLIAGSFVSHVTGFGTQVGISLGHQDYAFGVELLVIPIFFILGGVITSLVLDRKWGEEPGTIPNYPIVQSLITFLLGLVAILSSVGFFNQMTLKENRAEMIFLIAVLCLICGLKNGLTTWATHGKIRTTHLTGLSTDIGLHFPKLFRAEGSASRYPEMRKVNKVRIITLISFSLGSCLAALLIPILGNKIFYLSFFISLLLWVTSVTHRQRLLSKINNNGIVPIQQGV